MNPKKKSVIIAPAKSISNDSNSVGTTVLLQDDDVKEEESIDDTLTFIDNSPNEIALVHECWSNIQKRSLSKIGKYWIKSVRSEGTKDFGLFTMSGS